MRLIWVNISKLNIMKTLQVEFKKLTFLKTSKEGSFELKQHAKHQLFTTI